MDSLFSKLEVKPKAQDPTEYKINIGQEKQEVTIQTKLINKIGKTSFNRQEFNARLQGHQKQEMPVTAPISEPSKSLVSTQFKKRVPPSRKLALPTVMETEPQQADVPPTQAYVPPTQSVAPATSDAPAAPVTVKIEKKLGKIKLKTNLRGTVTKVSEMAPAKRKSKPPEFTGLPLETPLQVVLGSEILKQRVAKSDNKLSLPYSTFYMNNRSIFTDFINQLFEPFKQQLDTESKNITCENRSRDGFSLLTHQSIIRDYMNMYTPYRGLLLYHGLGAGKTCGSIAIAEGFKETKQIMVLTPASLRMNYVEEIKKCGDVLYRKNQFWEFIETDDLAVIEQLSQAMNLSGKYIQKQHGAWLSNITKPSNFNVLTQDEKASLDDQLNEMIANKYQFINYNGFQERHLGMISEDFTINPFSNKVVIIDEAHNFISRIVNKLGRKDPSVSIQLYNYLMHAENCRIILLTGTPIINYPNEIGVLFNILRGKIKVWTLTLNIQTKRKIDKAALRTILQDMKTLDYMDYVNRSNTGILTITRNPNSFINRYALDNGEKAYAGVQNKEMPSSEKTEELFFVKLTKLLAKNDIKIANMAVPQEYEALPDTLDDFASYFINDADMTLKNKLMFQKRIIGLTSYFRSAQEQLMPKYDVDKGDYQTDYIDMSDYQFGVYEAARKDERDLERRNSRKRKRATGTGELFDNAVSTYRIFSRSFCNFVFPDEIKRPMPTSGTLKESMELMAEEFDKSEAKMGMDSEFNPDAVLNVLENVKGEQDKETVDPSELLLQEELVSQPSLKYEEQIQEALRELEARGSEFLTPKALETYSPKFLHILENLKDPEHVGLNLIYTQFRTLEGIGILKLVLQQNGFMHFKISKDPAGQWFIDVPPDILAERRPGFILYTGTETSEEKEIMRNIFNSDWEYVPPSIVSELKTLDKDNIFGQIIKCIMITASGAEGITLKNVRYVHLVEPYWHPVRTQQVIGRARRICSHQDLPEKYRTVQVILYLMKLSDAQIAREDSIDLRQNDRSKFDNASPVTTDQTLYEISKKKENITSQILNAVKESSIDCNVHDLFKNEGLQCLTLGKSSINTFSYQPSLSGEEQDVDASKNVEKITWFAREIMLNDRKYALREDTDQLYTYESYRNALEVPGAKPILLGSIIRDDDGNIKKIVQSEISSAIQKR